MPNTLNAPMVPKGNLEGFKKYLPKDVLAGFLVFLIALPLCLGISIASGYPPIAGIFTAVVGSVLTTFLSNSELTIKGPAAGLIVIVFGAVTDFKEFFPEGSDPLGPYRMALAVGVVAGVIQIGFGLLRLGVLGEFFPLTVVHGMLSAIGVIIISKQIHVALGQSVKGEPLELLAEIPHSIAHMNPEIALIGAISMLLLFGIPMIPFKPLKRVPVQMVVILVAIPLGIFFNLSEEHTYTFLNHTYKLDDHFLVEVPNNLFAAISHPDFSVLYTAGQWHKAWYWVVMFALIGSLESLLSAKAVDMLDPYKRKTNLNRDLFAVGVANTVSSAIGGLPMISEIVRSKANIDSGARTRFADMWHGIFLLLFVALLPNLIHRIPLAALAAMLVYTGFRLASPREFIHVYHIGREQLLIFVGTLVGVLATDLLIGVFIGIGIKLAIHVINGVPIDSLFKTYLDIEDTSEDTSTIRARQSAVFSNWIPFKRQIEDIGFVQKRNLIIDLSEAKLVDHSVMEKLHELQDAFSQEGLSLQLIGLNYQRPLAKHELAARKQGVKMHRLTLVADAELKPKLEQLLLNEGASTVYCLNCSFTSRNGVQGRSITGEQCRLETMVTLESSAKVLGLLRRDYLGKYNIEVGVDQITGIVRDVEPASAPSSH